VTIPVAYRMYILRQKDYCFLVQLLYPHEVVHLKSEKSCRSALKLTFCFPTPGVLFLRWSGWSRITWWRILVYRRNSWFKKTHQNSKQQQNKQTKKTKPKSLQEMAL